MTVYAPCMDCGVDTTPCHSPQMCKSEPGCRHDGYSRWEYYMVWPAVWARAVGPYARGFLCIEHLETRLGRPLNGDDFTLAPINWLEGPESPRLAAAKARKPEKEDPTS